jgi:hypothetical protein
MTAEWPLEKRLGRVGPVAASIQLTSRRQKSDRGKLSDP